MTVQTDVPCSNVSGTAFTSGQLGAIETAPPTTVSTTCSADGHLGTVVLVPSGASNSPVGFKVVTALGSETLDRCGSAAAAGDPSCIVARRELRYLPHTPLVVIVDMKQSCAGVLCDATSTCVDGACRSATLDPQQCAGAGCDESALGPVSSDGGADGGATDAGDGGDATVGDSAVDAPFEAGPGVPACDLGGLQAGAPWPMQAYCPSARNQSPLVGPSAQPVHLWTYKAGDIDLGPAVAADGTVYAAMNQNVVALDPGDGGVRWKYASGSDASLYNTMPAIAADDTLRVLDRIVGTYTILGLDGSVVGSSPTPFETRGGITLGGDGTMYFTDTSANLVAMLRDGAVRWSTHGAGDDFVVPAVAKDGTVYGATSSGSFVAVYPDGGIRWDVQAGGSYETGSAIAPDGTLRVAKSVTSGGAMLYALDASSGAVIWSKVVDPDAVNGLAVADDGTTYVCGNTIVTAWTSGGTAAGTSANECAAPMVDANGDVYAQCGSGITSFDHGLDVRWQIGIPGYLGSAITPPVLGRNGVLLIATSDTLGNGAIDAFGPP